MTKATAKLCMGCMAPLEGDTVCSHCGYDANLGYDANYIKPGTVLNSRYLVGRLVHKNGEGARYVGYDNSLSKTVWIHEYFPHSIAQRGEETGNILPVQGYGAQYKAHMSDFLDTCNEVKRLAATEPLIPIENVFSQNNTIYAVYQDIDAIPLETYLQQQGGQLSPGETAQLFTPLLSTISNIHSTGQIHRGICPYTVYIGKDNQLYLWHFALAATRTAGSELQAELFSGYSAPEQYSPSGWQGSWTDVYALGALLYRTMSGVVPPKSTLIGSGRPLQPLADLVMGLPKYMGDAVMDAMHVVTESRTQTVATLQTQLAQTGRGNTTVYDLNKVTRPDRSMPLHLSDTPASSTSQKETNKQDREEKGVSAKYVVLALLLTVIVLAGLIAAFMKVVYPSLAPNQPSTSQTDTQQPTTSPQLPTEELKLVPKFFGKRLEDLQSNPEYTDRFSFKVKEEHSEDWPIGTVYLQQPLEGTPIPEDGVITLTVSKGPLVLKMPDLTGLTQDAAKELLNTLDPSINATFFTKYDSQAEPGTVISTTPEAEAEFSPKQDVVIFVAPEASKQESAPPQRNNPPQSSSEAPSWLDQLRQNDQDSPPPIQFRN